MHIEKLLLQFLTPTHLAPIVLDTCTRNIRIFITTTSAMAKSRSYPDIPSQHWGVQWAQVVRPSPMPARRTFTQEWGPNIKIHKNGQVWPIAYSSHSIIPNHSFLFSSKILQFNKVKHFILRTKVFFTK